MRFLVDAHLPPGLCDTLQKALHDAVHTRDLPAQNRTTDEFINELSIREHRVVITKDTDFYHSHLLHGKPWKLVVVRTGNIRARDLIDLIAAHLPAIEAALESHSLVELDREEVRVVV